MVCGKMRTGSEPTSHLTHIVIVDDEPLMRTLIRAHLEIEFPLISEAGSCAELERILASQPVDLVLIDIMLPDKDGFSLTRDLRSRSDIGIIIISKKNDDYDRILGLEIGADDYLSKPFLPRELVARVKTVLRRIHRIDDSIDMSSVLRFDNWMFDLNARTLTDATGDSSRLTSAEFLILSRLIQKPGRIVAREAVLSALTTNSVQSSERSIDVLVSRLRRKLKDNARDPKYIITVHGEGYIFAPQTY